MLLKAWKQKKLPLLANLAVIFVMSVFILSGCGSAATTPAGNAANNTAAQVPPPAASASAAQLVVKVLDIGQGDAVLIRTPQEVVLIDTGDIPLREEMAAHLQREKIAVLDKLIMTHPHADHLGGITEILGKIEVKQIYDNGTPATSNLYKQYLSLVKKEKIPFAVVKDGDVIDLGADISLKILSPRRPFFSGTDGDLNNNSLVAKLVFKNFSLLLTGDAEKESEQELVKKHGQELKADLLKSPHHGSSSSSSAGFLKAVAPKAAIISLGAGNSYHHPHPSVLKRYKDRKIDIYRTDLNGTITITSDGQSYQIAKEKRS
ncbi:MAG: MBL fold metallo-hydrolase [Sporomusaceae bacterium]|jgi:competence protein ComEC|nr:MBL fold metallo-hydrolase [Sporomusaceae bacterium]